MALSLNSMIRKRDRERSRYHISKLVRTDEQKKKIVEAMQKYRQMYPEKYKASCVTRKMDVTVKGNQIHHWSYKEEHRKDIIELRRNLHNIAHRFLKYDQSLLMYRTSYGVLLDTKEKHYNYLLQIFRKEIVSYKMAA